VAPAGRSATVGEAFIAGPSITRAFPRETVK